MAIIFPEGTQDFPTGIIKQDVQPWSTRLVLSSSGSWETVVSGSYTKVGGTSTELYVTFVGQHTGEVYGSGSFRLDIGGSTFYGQYNWGGYGAYQRSSIHTFRVTGLSAGSKSWTIYTRYRGPNVMNPTSNDQGNINDSFRGPSTITFQESA